MATTVSVEIWELMRMKAMILILDNVDEDAKLIKLIRKMHGWRASLLMRSVLAKSVPLSQKLRVSAGQAPYSHQPGLDPPACSVVLFLFTEL